MPLNARNQRTFHRRLYATQLESVVFLNPEDDQRQGVTHKYVLYGVRWSMIHKQGEPIAGQMASHHYRTLHIPRIELDRIGVHYINVLATFIDKEGRTWINEATEPITNKLFMVHWCVACRLLDGGNGTNPNNNLVSVC